MDRLLLKMKEGDTWNLSVELRQADGSAYPLDGMTAHMQIRNAPKGAVIADLSSADGDIALNDPEDGDVSVVVSSDKTQGITRGNQSRMVYADLELRDSADPPLVITVLAVEFEVSVESTVRV